MQSMPKLLTLALASVLTAFLLVACDKGFQPEGLKLSQTQAQRVSIAETTNSHTNLADWGMLYLNDGKLNLRSDATPYHLNTPLFSDYAHKFRSIWLPDNTQIEIETNGDFIFPIGSIISKTFYYPRESFTDELLVVSKIDKSHSEGSSIDLNKFQLIETRLLVKQRSGWQALPYVWNKEQTSATLEITGAAQKVRLTDSTAKDFTYIVPDANQCKGCHVSNHTSGKLKPIGPKVRHMNLDYSYKPNLTQNQISSLYQLGKIKELPTVLNANLDWRKRQQDINLAARSYLDISCGHCHNPDGPADTSALYLNIENVKRAHLGICKTPVAAGKGTGDRPYDITPGDSNKSIISYRMQSNDPSIAMPELGRAVMHEEGVKLIAKWIDQLEGGCNIPSA